MSCRCGIGLRGIAGTPRPDDLPGTRCCAQCKIWSIFRHMIPVTLLHTLSLSCAGLHLARPLLRLAR